MAWLVISAHDGERHETSLHGAGCLPNLDHVQNAPTWCMQGTSALHTDDTTWRPTFDVSIELCKWHRSVNHAAGAILKRCNCISMIDVAFSIWYYTPYSATTRRPGVEIMSVILLQPVAISTETSTDRPCALDMCNTARSFTHESNTCVIRRLAFLNPGFIQVYWPTVLYPAPCHPPQPCIIEFWFVHEPPNLEIVLREVGNFKDECASVWHWVILVAPRRVRKIN